MCPNELNKVAREFGIKRAVKQLKQANKVVKKSDRSFKGRLN